MGVLGWLIVLLKGLGFAIWMVWGRVDLLGGWDGLLEVCMVGGVRLSYKGLEWFVG